MPTQKNQGENRLDPALEGLSKPQKNAVIFLAALAVFVVVFWVWQIRDHINSPFDYKLASSGDSDVIEENYNSLLNNTDTDHDGLSDYEEIYVQHTSPYLADTDSDGLLDKQEVGNGTDPLCPQGKVCGAVIDTGSAPKTEPAAPIVPGISGDSLIGLTPTAADEAALKDAVGGKSDAATLRRLLVSGGAPADEINKISDADLMKIYQELLESQNAAQAQQAGE